jgi:outer membrane biosynthesis protein TonB
VSLKNRFLLTNSESRVLPAAYWRSTLRSDCVLPYPPHGSVGAFGAPEQFFNCAEGKLSLVYSVAVMHQHFSLVDDSLLDTVTILAPPSESADNPTASPTAQPVAAPTARPTAQPVAAPTASPTAQPTTPTASPTSQPTNPTASPTAQPVTAPTASPTAQPVAAPTASPTAQPATPTASPTAQPVAAPTASPTAQPATPTASPSDMPVAVPQMCCPNNFTGFRGFENCSKWYRCLNGKPITGATSTCSPGTTFDARYSICNWSSDANTCNIQPCT